MAVVSDVIKLGTRAAQPLASAVGAGTLYVISDESYKIERSTGAVWNWIAQGVGAGVGFSRRSETGVGNQIAIASTSTLVILANASLLNIQGIVAGTPGQKITFLNTGASQTDFEAAAGGAAAANRVYNGFAAGRKLSLAPQVGVMTLEYDDTIPGWRVVHHEQGNWITPTFSAGNFTADTGATWTVASGNVNHFAYWVKGHTMHLAVCLSNTVITVAAPTTLMVTLPGGFVAAALDRMPINWQRGATIGVGTCGSNGAADTKLNLYSDYAGTVWAIAASLHIGLLTSFEVN